MRRVIYDKKFRDAIKQCDKDVHEMLDYSIEIKKKMNKSTKNISRVLKLYNKEIENSTIPGFYSKQKIGVLKLIIKNNKIIKQNYLPIITFYNDLEKELKERIKNTQKKYEKIIKKFDEETKEKEQYIECRKKIEEYSIQIANLLDFIQKNCENDNDLRKDFIVQFEETLKITIKRALKYSKKALIKYPNDEAIKEYINLFENLANEPIIKEILNNK